MTDLRTGPTESGRTLAHHRHASSWRALHPGAWWLWAGGLALAAMRTTNVVVLGLIVAVVAVVVAARRSDAPWARSFRFFVWMAVAVVAFRLLQQILFGDRVPGTELFSLPSIGLPSWAAGISIGGTVTVESLVDAFQRGLQLAVVLICFGAVNSLCSPYRMLQALPAALYEAGVVVTVALTFAPEAVIELGRLREARRLRGRPVRGVAALRGLALPVLEGGLDRAVALAASMDSRGYGRSNQASTRARGLGIAATVVGLLVVAVGLYGLADAGAPGALGLPLLGLGALGLAAGLFVGGRRAVRTRYRPDPWRGPEWVVSASGLVALGATVVAGRLPGGGAALNPASSPLAWPSVPVVAVVGILVALAPAVAAPPSGAPAMIRFDRVGFTYPDASRPALAGVDLTIDEGELCLVVGRTGSGKSTLLRAVNGLVPRFTGGLLTGTVTVAGRSTADHPPRDLADVVGLVGQDPASGFVTDTVEEELAYSMGNLGVAPDVMRRRVEDALDLLGLHELRQRPLRSLSGGQQQRVAIGAALTASPQVIVLDEPTSALDPAAAEEVLAALTRLVHDLGITVVIAEHRLERVVQYADLILYLPGAGGAVELGDPATVLATCPVVPPVVELGRLAGWSPLPLSIRDARRRADPLRQRLGSRPPGPPDRSTSSSTAPTGSDSSTASARVDGLSAAFGSVVALRSVDLALDGGQVVAVMGRNGSGKSTLLAHLAGLRAPQVGRVVIDGRAPSELAPRQAIALVGMVPQDPLLLLNGSSVAGECQDNDHDAGLDAGTTRATLDRLATGLDPGAHPRDLSEGQRLVLALALVLAPAPPVVVLDEPTRGLDYQAKHHLVGLLAELAAAGHLVVLATHDVEVVARVADRVVVLAEGEVVADGPARQVVVHSPVFAPQVAKVLAPGEWLTVAEVRAALADRPDAAAAGVVS